MTDFNPKEYKVTALRECPVPGGMLICDTADQAAEYWRMHIATHRYFDPERECLVVLFLNTRKRVKGHQLVTIGLMDTLLVHLHLLDEVEDIAAVRALAEAIPDVLAHAYPELRGVTALVDGAWADRKSVV